MTRTKRTDTFTRKGVKVTVELDYLTDGKEYYFDAKMGSANLEKIKQAFRGAGLSDEYLDAGSVDNFTKLD
jgi:hypothetical protein